MLKYFILKYITRIIFLMILLFSNVTPLKILCCVLYILATFNIVKDMCNVFNGKKIAKN